MPNEMSFTIVGFGSSASFAKKAPAQLIELAASAVATLGQGAVLSRLFRSPAWPDPTEPPYVNAAMMLKTALAPGAFLAALHAIEAGFGRVRSADPALRYAPRSLDLDLIDMGGQVLAQEGLFLPHPRAAERAFVLAPLLDVAPDWVDPVSGERGEELLARAVDRVDLLPFTGGPSGGARCRPIP